MDAVTRVLKVLNHEEPDKMATYEGDFTSNTIAKHYLGSNVDPYATIALTGKVYKIPFSSQVSRMLMKYTPLNWTAFKTHAEIFKRAKIDLLTPLLGQTPWKYIKGGYIDNFGRMHQIENYAGDNTKILGYRGGIFKNFEDYENFQGHPDPYSPTFLKNLRAIKKFQVEKLKNEVFIAPGYSGLMETTWEGFGIEVFSKILTKPKQAKKIFDDRGKLALECTKVFAENDAKAVMVFDDYGYKKGLFMSPRNYRMYVFPWMKQMCKAAHKHDCKLILHSCGDIEPIFGDLVEAGVDAFNPIEATTSNPEYDIFKLNERFGDKITLIGNIAPQMLSTGTKKEIEDYSKKLIRELAPGGGFIFASGHSINPAIPLENFLEMVKVREKYGKYPINVPN